MFLGIPLETTQDAQAAQIAQTAQVQTSEKAKPAYDVTSFFSSRIVGGVDAPKGFAPYMVALITGDVIKFFVCGGSIISKHHVLTAAHCIEPFVHWGELSESFTGLAGSNYWNATYVVIKFCGYRNHPDWDWATIKNDIGILITAVEISFTVRVRPITLNFDWVGGGEKGYVAGWGRLGAWENIPYWLQLLLVKILSPKECHERMLQAAGAGVIAPPVDPKIEMCTFAGLGSGMCNGDSGSALVKILRQQHGHVIYEEHVQVGIVSWGIPCARGVPDVFVRVSGYKSFVTETLRTHNTCKR
ncbi:chymotrypsin-2 [Bicyclus anynana]|uniref:Chymotrypsin-2 n=1 Tax=Bicyclus anynana TaxID=110368 RepID=A0ABM3LTA5_BICAN|nr:chymotrypsin-2 [Bicyclus anynana]